MASAVATMPSSVSTGSANHHRSDSEAGPHGFTAVNITPPHSRESSATSPDVSPRHGTASAGRHTNPASLYLNGHEPGQHKRRRSMSSDRDLRSPRRYDYHPPKKVETQQQQHMADRALHVLDTNHHSHHSYYSTTPNSAQDRAGYVYERPYQGPDRAHSTPEGRLAEAFSRDTSEHHYASSGNGGDNDRADDSNEKQTPSQNGQKRKRNFSNRTKTGCITCRSRKKKCDEGRPHCNNCIRGGFPCQGYNHTRPGTWSKPAPQKDVPLVSKDNNEVSSYYENQTPASTHPSSAEVTSQIRSNVAEHGHDQSRPHYVPSSTTPADTRPPYSGQHQQPQWTQHPPQQPQPHHGPSPQTSYPPEHLPPFSEFSRPEQSQQHPPPSHQHHQARQDYSTTPQREMSRPPTQASGPPPNTGSASNLTPIVRQQQAYPQPQPAPQSQPQYQPSSHPPHQHQPPQQEYNSRPQYPPRIDTTQPPQSRVPQPGPTPATAATATPHAYTPHSYSSATEIKPSSTATTTATTTTAAATKLFTNEDVERSRMLRGAPYNYFDRTLSNERLRCSNALKRYNDASQLISGVSDSEAHALLLKVFIPKEDTTHAFLAPCRHEGILGPGVRIEPGFRCTYGYNIKIFDNVFIGERTRIDDSAPVEIGARTWIASDVAILTNDVVKDMVARKGTDGQTCMSKGVVVGSEVVIGSGAKIWPGVRIGRGATIEPFAVVKGDIGDYVTVRCTSSPQMGGVH